MNIEARESVATITGNIKSVSDFQAIKSVLDGVVAQHSRITVNIPESLSITSSVIGYLNKLVLKDKVVISMSVGNQQLLDLLEDLNLASVFNAKKS